MAQPDDLVLYAFRAPVKDAARPEHMGYAWDNGWRYGDVVYSQAGPYASWSAKVRERLAVAGARVARPVLATNGRHTVGGWKATKFVEGQLARRVDETAQLGLRVEEALSTAMVQFSGLILPAQRDDVFARAELAAWEETGEAYSATEAELADAPVLGVGHADLLATTIFAGANPPTIVDIVPTAAPRPRGYTTALVCVDGLINDAVDPGICDRFAYIAGFDHLLLRAAAYRRHVNNLHPAASANTRAKISEVEDLLVSRVSGTLA
ncbi:MULTISPECIES: hypothetical protein [Corynebacterium]|uniref:hypothetical protein n=1 Tax=Corynebacterium TaxID=1716 RepID=UPI00211C537E|nr:hypothetical protein [Corynebacterium phoceense]MCQ9330457.1 hypothetical protein [Corynebacterium phoceense]MCQ9341996.1 hypothetical protein [Corynebacterium phoceense]MCQ9349199.1 hypothetical protein [Corynebacterium phoceense]